MLEQALSQHDRLISPEVRPLHEHLVGKWREMRESLQKQQPIMMTTPPGRAHAQHPQATTTARRISRSASSRKGPLPPVPPQAAFSSSPSSTAPRLSMTSMTMSCSDGIYSQPQSASDSSSNSSTSASSLMTMSLTSLMQPAAAHNLTSSSISPLRHQNSSRCIAFSM